MVVPGNLFANLDAADGHETVATLLARPGVRIERIISRGSASLDGFWYDQPQDEWVVVLMGAATLEFADDGAPHALAPGDHLLIPAHRRHRVAETAADGPTVWLAVHISQPPEIL